MKKQCLTWFLLVFFAFSAYSQSFKDLLAKGDKFYARKDFVDALKTYLEAYALDPESPEANFKVGVSYLHGETKSKAVPYLEKAYRIKPSVDLDIDYHLGMAYQHDHQYGKAKRHFHDFKVKNKQFSEIANHKIAECEIGDSLSNHPAYVTLENVGDGVNSPFHEYSPLLTPDGRTMIFSSNRSTDDYKIKSGTNFEDIYITHHNGSSWSTPEKISPNINIKYHDAAASLSPDGKTLFLYYEEGAGDIYRSDLVDGSWTKPVPLNKNINTPLFWETSACISADGKKLYFTSNRPGGKGELDIYVSELDSKGEWGKAVNLGPTINTPMNEDSPFIHPDGVTLYFSSDGHPSMGSNDIFMSEFKNNKWNRPVNMGYPINSIEYDGFFTISADKKTGYFSTIRQDGLGSSDIYKIRFHEPPKKVEPAITAIASPPIEEPKPEPVVTQPEPVVTQPEPVVVATVAEPIPVEPEPIKHEQPREQPKVEQFVDPVVELHKEMKIVTVLKGKVIDAESSAPLYALITLINNENRAVVSRITSDPATGSFELVIPHGGNYGVSTETTGYLFNSINFNLPQFAEFQEIDTHILMMKPEVGSKVVLKNIFFDTGKSELKSESLSELENLRELLVTNNNLKVQINGHTDNTGHAETNKTLSLHRAQAVVDYLVQKGIDSSRLTAKGFGSERPLVSNDDEQEGREINRRTEIEIIETETQKG